MPVLVISNFNIGGCLPGWLFEHQRTSSYIWWFFSNVTSFAMVINWFFDNVNNV